MEQLKERPILCIHCDSLAFAVLDGVALCETCLFGQVTALSSDPKTLHIEPLPLVPVPPSAPFLHQEP